MNPFLARRVGAQSQAEMDRKLERANQQIAQLTQEIQTLRAEKAELRKELERRIDYAKTVREQDYRLRHLETENATLIRQNGELQEERTERSPE